MGRLDEISYGMLDQTALNQTMQQIIVLRRDGIVNKYEWTLEDGPKADEPFAFDDLQQIKKTLIDSHSVDIKFAPIDLGGDYLWDINVHIEVK